jgi:hypothetical protein
VPPDKKKTVDLLWRLVTLVGLLFLACLWVRYHLGAIWLLLVGIMPVLVAVIGVVAKLPGKKQGEAIMALVRDVLQTYLLSTASLVAFGVVLVLVGLVVSSVTIIPEQPQDHVVGSLSRLGGSGPGKAFDREGLVRRIVVVGPFGSRFQLRIDRHLPETLCVYPIMGRQVNVSRDLRWSPSVLFRPPWSTLGSLENEGTITVKRVDDGVKTVIARGVGHRGSYLLGHAQPIPDSWQDGWERELKALGLLDKHIAQTLDEWRRFELLRVDPNTTLAPGMTLEADVATRIEKIKARVTVTLGNDSLVDVPIPETGG